MNVDRRVFIRDFGRGVLGITVGGVLLGACGGEEGATTTTAAPATTASTAASTTTVASTTTTQATTTTSEAPATTVAPTGDLSVERVSFGFVSAYVLVRGTEAAIVDTGQGNAAGAIEPILAELGLGWDAVGSVVLTHRHGDHVGGLSSVAEASGEAVISAGVADLGGINAPGRAIEPLEDGDTVFGSTIVATPGHTDGHICVFDPVASVLVAGDALVGEGTPFPLVDGIGGSPPEFTSDADAANDSVRKLAALEPDTIWFGHGEPIVGGAAAKLTALAASL